MKMFSGGIVVSMSNNSNNNGQFIKTDPELTDCPSGFPIFDGLTSGVPTRTTPTLTPTTLRNIEQAFIELSSGISPSQHQHQAGFVPPVVQPSTQPNTHGVGITSYTTLDTKSWHGGTTTVASNSSNNLDPYPYPMSNTSNEDSIPSPPVRKSTGGRRPRKDDKVSPEEEEKRRIRRERNKLAAARCRKRRLDHTNLLIEETEGLEADKQNLQDEIQRLQSQKEELEYMLENHKASGCKMSKSSFNYKADSDPISVKQEPRSPARAEIRPIARPNSLPVSSVTAITGISITTPSSAVQGLSLDSLLDSGMGFTPVSNSLTPVSGSTLMTPVSSALITPSMPESCASQQRNFNGTELSSPDSVPPKLVSL